MQFFRESRRFHMAPRQHDRIPYYSLRDVSRIFALPRQERSENELLLRGPRGSVTFFKDKAEIRVNGEAVPLSQPVWRRRGDDWYVTLDFFDKALPRIVGVYVNRKSATTFELLPLPAAVEVKVQISLFPDHTRVMLEPSQPVDFQVREVGVAVEIVAANRRMHVAVPSSMPKQGFLGSLVFDSSGNGMLRAEKGPAFQRRREQTLDDPFRKIIDFYGPPAMPATPPPLPAPGTAQVPVLPPVPASPGISSPSFQPQKFVRRPNQNVVVLDSGHGGSDLGAHLSTELLEKDLTVRLARQIKTEIEASSPYKVVITRELDTAMGILQRTAIANSYHAEIFVSLHFGGSYDPSMRGAFVYFYSETGREGKQEEKSSADEATPAPADLKPWVSAQLSLIPRSQALAARLQAKLNQVFGTPDTQVGSNQFLVLQGCLSPAVILEAGYLTNFEDAMFLADATNVKKVAHAIALGILDFLRMK